MSSTKSNLDIGLIGVGTMGRHMLSLLRQNGFNVFAFDPMPAAQVFISESGAVSCKDGQDVAAHVEVIILSLPKPQHVLSTVEHLNSSLSNAHVVVDTSTVSPETTLSAIKILASSGANYVDAPILGRPSAAGKWLLPAGGSEVAIAKAKPYLCTFARDVIRVGNSGAGNVFKLLNQLMFSVINGISTEVMALTDVLGIDRKVFFDVISQSGAATVSGLFKETAIRTIDEHYDDPNFTIELLCKDAGLGIQMAKDAGVNPLIAGFVQNLNENAKGVGLAKKDTSSMTKMFSNYFAQLI